MADTESAGAFLSDLAEKITRDSGRSCLIIIGDNEGSLVGVCVAEHELAAMAGQLRLLADTLAEQAAAGMN
jgi:hypothetical protein